MKKSPESARGRLGAFVSAPIFRATNDRKSHWNAVYEETLIDQLGWYEPDEISRLLGPELELLRDFDYLYHQPSDDPRPYGYTLFRRAEN